MRSKADYKIFHIPLDIFVLSAIGPTLIRGRNAMGHIHYFTRESAATMLARHGFRVRYVGTDPKAFTVRYYLAKGGGYAPTLSRALIKGAEAVGQAERMWAPDFRDRMIVIADRPEAAGQRPA